MIKDGISVIVCCFNSSVRLPQTIKHLCEQDVPDSLPWEIILIDNASTDDTAAVAKSEWLKNISTAVSFTVIKETKPGLSYARQKGVENSKFDYIVFCDDDNWLDKNYLKTAYQIISQNNKIAALGGCSTATSTINLPDWFEASKKNYAVGKQANSDGNVSHRKYLWGSGIIFRKELFNKAFLNFPSLLTGRKGEELLSGEDSEMCMRFLLMGYQLHYSSNLAFTHFIAANRLTEDYNKKLMEGFIKAHEILKIYARFIDTCNLKFTDKYFLLTKSLLKVIICNVLFFQNRNNYDEKLNIFIISGLKFKGLNKGWISLRKLIPGTSA